MRMGGVVKVRQVLPDRFAEALRRLYVPGAPSTTLRAAVLAATERGWTYRAVANALGVSLERVRQLATSGPRQSGSPIEIPEPPSRPEPFKREPPPTLTEGQAEQLRDLKRRSNVSGPLPDDHPTVVAAQEFARLVDLHLKAGHRISDLARSVGISRTALQFRLGRYGYRGLPPSQQKMGRVRPAASPAARDLLIGQKT